MRTALLAAAALLGGSGARAQTPPPAPSAVASPEQLALARRVAARLLPPGAYGTVMHGALDGLIGSMMDRMLDVPVRQFVQSAGLSEGETARLGGATTRQIMAIVDPAYEQRMKLTTQTVLDGMGRVMVTLEPQIREGLAEAYAARFSAAQLGQLDAFFATPTGTAFAAQQFTIMSDPAMARRLQAIMPAILGALPDLLKQAQAATAGLPKPKTRADLTADDRARLAALLHVEPKALAPATASSPKP